MRVAIRWPHEVADGDGPVQVRGVRLRCTLSEPAALESLPPALELTR